MKTSAIIGFLAVAGLSAATPSPHPPRDLGNSLASMKRDTSGAGFTHIGSDNVARSFDADLNVLDYRELAGSAPSGDVNWPRAPGADVLAELRRAFEQSAAQSSKPQARGPLDAAKRAAAYPPNCVSENCRDDQMCKDLSLYGYNCSSCLMVQDFIGNCQTI
ncbi:hypothetical protein GGR52DRAFT_574650 [Hypoxylon sp. FL1284]|nr:hypothetical protein GGR52DRAFT_574650 [Hypoxylon sp. FL1284]